MPQELLVQFHHVCGDCVNAFLYNVYSSECICRTIILCLLYEITRDGSRCHRLPQLWRHCLRKQWPENCPKWNSKQCAPQPPASQPDEECTLMRNPPGCGEVNGRVLTFDSTALYPQLWINDSKRPYPGGLMRSARLQAEQRRQWKMWHWRHTVI